LKDLAPRIAQVATPSIREIMRQRMSALIADIRRARAALATPLAVCTAFPGALIFIFIPTSQALATAKTLTLEDCTAK
jgi:hypothetical protein